MVVLKSFADSCLCVYFEPANEPWPIQYEESHSDATDFESAKRLSAPRKITVPGSGEVYNYEYVNI